MGRARLAGVAIVGWLASVALAAVPAAPAAEAAVRAPKCRVQQGSPAAALTTRPWAQERLNFTEAWALTTGKGTKVAVVDSGVDVSHPQLAGHVKAFDVSDSNDDDCVGHGTGVAGIVAAQDLRSKRIPFLGVAPGAQVLSVKYTNAQSDPEGGARLAEGIRLAVDKGADIVNVSTAATDSAPLRSAVQHAREKDVLIVAAAGNVDEKEGTTGPAYPADYPGVLSVGAVGPDGGLKGFSNATTHVSVTAPGEEVISTWPVSSYSADQGTSFSAPFVAGTAALVRSHHPELSADQVKRRIEATADGGTATGTGGGMINPLQAVTAVLPEEAGGGPAPGRPTAVSIDQPNPNDRFARTFGLALAVGAIGAAGAVIAGAVIIPAGRRRGWRPGRHGPVTSPGRTHSSG